MTNMTYADIARLRLHNQRIARTKFTKPNEVVEWLGAVQAQDYLGSLWAVGLRMANATEADNEQALATRAIVRTWPMRGTIHLVPPAHVRWMLELLTPRVIAAGVRRVRQVDLDERAFARSKELIARALQGGKQLTRSEMYQVLKARHISSAGLRGPFILHRLAADGLICSAGRRGKQQTFALLSEWVPAAKSLPRDEALSRIALRYFSSHGPAIERDFAWWTGLTLADSKLALDMVKSQLASAVADGTTYWMAPGNHSAGRSSPTTCLLPGFDEYLVGYTDRRAVFDADHLKRSQSLQNWLNPPVVVDGRVIGTWKRALARDHVVVEIRPFVPMTKAVELAIARAADRYGAFLGKTVVMAKW